MTSPRVRRKSGDSDRHVYSVSLLVRRVGRRWHVGALAGYVRSRRRLHRELSHVVRVRF